MPYRRREIFLNYFQHCNISSILFFISVGEDQKFISQFQALLSAKSLPCFCVVNELSLSFETDAESLRGDNICFSFILLFFRILLSILFARFNSLNGLSHQTFFRFLLCIYHSLPTYHFPFSFSSSIHSFLPSFLRFLVSTCLSTCVCRFIYYSLCVPLCVPLSYYAVP